MAENILIGIGGTGARIVESILPLALSGMGPQNLTIGFVDQDRSNGNVRRSRQFVKQYEEFRRLWSGGEHPCRLDWESVEGGTSLARNAISPLVRDSDLWCPHPDEGSTLLTILNASLLPQDEKNMLSLLFEPGPAEQEMTLGVGYQARPHIGATAMVSKVVAGDPFWDVLKEKIKIACGGEEVRIFLAGSVFGGVGAAGFPTIARVIRRFVKELEDDGFPVTGRISVGGVLALPYFSFPQPKDNENVARSEQLLAQSRGALKYYHELFKQELVFNELYVLGWDPRFTIKLGSKGGNDQANPSMLPELIAATSALRFFDTERKPAPSEVQGQLFICGRETADTIQWTDLPPASDAKAIEAYEKLGNLLRFCAVWRNTIRGALTKRTWRRQAWKVLQGVDAVNLSDASNEQRLKSLDVLIDSVLVWAGSLSSYASKGGIAKFGLWDTTGLVRFNESDLKEPVRIADLSDSEAVASYNRLVIPLDNSNRPADQASLWAEISNVPMPGAHLGLGKVLAAAYRGARVK